ncbi:hypothetical protein MSIBF_A1400004 [groundwater metagenome]|uniref:Uncharacterized protein n=1 Tax=groundwater metagenome TaxID=717931 RepID=A0A098E784_9ZZZZ
MTKKQKYVSDMEVIQYIKEQEVVTWDSLEKRFGITRVALWRKLKKHKKITSLNKNSKYFTILNFVEDKMDDNGIWKYNDLIFSIHGGVCDTIKYLVDTSNQGIKCKDLDIIMNISTGPHLLKTIKKGYIVRGKISREWVYFSSNEKVMMQQLKKREMHDIVKIDTSQTEKSTIPQEKGKNWSNTSIKPYVVWKEKAKERRLKNKFLKQRVKELTTSRDSWKNKAKKTNNTSNDLERENIDLKKKT